MEVKFLDSHSTPTPTNLTLDPDPTSAVLAKELQLLLDSYVQIARLYGGP